jgi:hypothetical protein
MPELQDQQEEKYRDEIESIISYSDPYTKKPFYVVKGSESNIKNPNVFMVDVDDSGSPVFGTYEKPEGKNIWSMDYVKQKVRNYDDKPSRVFPISRNLEQLSMGINPYKNRKYLQDYTDDVFTNPNLNEAIRSKMSQYSTAKIQQQNGADYINRLKNG